MSDAKPATFATPQDVEDAYYDAIDEGDLDRLRQVWEESNDIACLLPMHPLVHGAAVHALFKPLFDAGVHLDIQVRHIRWVETESIAIHYIEERVDIPGQPPRPPIYATKIYRLGPKGWRIILHQSSPGPAPIPPGGLPPGVTLA